MIACREAADAGGKQLVGDGAGQPKPPAAFSALAMTKSALSAS